MVLFCEYLFTLVKSKDDHSVLKTYQVKNIFQPGVQHGKFIFNFHWGGSHGHYKIGFYGLIVLELDNTN